MGTDNNVVRVWGRDMLEGSMGVKRGKYAIFSTVKILKNNILDYKVKMSPNGAWRKQE